MNYSTAVFLINDQVRGVTVRYDPELNTKSNDVIFKTLDQDLAKDDLVVIPTKSRCKATVGIVIEVDVDVDLDSGQNMEWIVGRLDMGDYDRVVAEEEKAIATIRRAEVRQKRENMKASLFKDQEAMLSTLALSHTSEPEEIAEATKKDQPF